ncbi:MAG: class I SAM-dependent methyltransferase [Chloroflexota bacterium]
MEQELFDVLSEIERQAGAGITPYEAAKLVSILAVSNQAKTIVEVGSGVGYTTLWLAYAVSLTGGQVITCELDPARAEQTRAHLAKAGMAGFVEILPGDARDALRRRTEAVDFLFLDGDNSQYETYFDVVYKQMGVGALIVANGVVADEDELADYTTYVQNHPHLESVTVPLGAGLEVSVKISE